jgi:hypothetical protein
VAFNRGLFKLEEKAKAHDEMRGREEVLLAPRQDRKLNP